MCDQLIRAEVTMCHQDRVGQGHRQSDYVAQDMHSMLLIYQSNHLIVMVSDTDCACAKKTLQEHKEFTYGANKLTFHQNKAPTEPNNHSEAVKCVVQRRDGSAAEQMYSVENDDQLSPNSSSLFFH